VTLTTTAVYSEILRMPTILQALWVFNTSMRNAYRYYCVMILSPIQH